MSQAGLTKFSAEIRARAEEWAMLPTDELKRRAARAVNERDHEALWYLTESFLYLHGSAGANISPHTLRTYRRGVLDVLEAWRGENLLRPSRDAGVVYIRRWEAGVHSHTGKPASPKTIEVKLAAARTLYKALRWSGLTDADPFADVRPPTDKTPAWEKRRPYTVEEVERLLEAAELEDTIVVLLGAHAGLRVSEMTSLEWRDVNTEKQTLFVRHGKGGKQATVQMTNRLTNHLMEMRALSPSATTVLNWTPDHTRYRFKQLCARAGVEYHGAGLHGLRHGAGTRFYQQTGDLGKVAAHLRHADIQTTRIYAKVDTEDVARDIEDW